MTTDYAQAPESRQVRRQGERQEAKANRGSSTNLAVLQSQHKRIFTDLFSDFRSYRKQWDALIDRDKEAAVVIIPSSDGSPPVVIMSPELRKAMSNNVKIITQNAVSLDVVSLDPREAARRDLEDVRIWSALSLAKQNERKRLQRAIANQTVPYGVAAVWKRWEAPPEPDDDDLKEFLKDDDDKGGDAEARSKRREKARTEYYERWHQENDCFNWDSISVLQLGWFPLESPHIIIQDSIIPYETLKGLEDWEGRKGGLDNDGKVVFGQGVGSSEEPNKQPSVMREVHFIRRAMKEGDGRWWVTEWCASGNGGSLTSADVGDAKLLRRYMCPFDGPPYVIIPGGDEDDRQTNPHKRYWPDHMHSMIVLTQELNSLVSLTIQLGVERAKNPNYIRIASMDAQMLPMLKDLLEPLGLAVTMEGAGAERAGLIKRVEVNSSEMPVLPDVQPLPDTIEPALLARISWLQDVGIPSAMPNRWLVGQAFDETAGGTGTLGLNQMQAAAIPFDQDVTNVADGIETLLEMELDAVAYWDRETEEGSAKVYPTRARSDAPVTKRPPQDGDAVEMRPEKLRHPYNLVVTGSNETQADRQVKEQAAMQKEAAGYITKSQALEEMGFEDPERQLEMLKKTQETERQEALFQPVKDEQIQRLALALTGIQMPMADPAMSGAPQGNKTTIGSPPQPATTPAPVGGSTSSSGLQGTMV